MKKIIYLLVFFAVHSSFGQDFTATVNSYLQSFQGKSVLSQMDVSDVTISSQSYSRSLEAYNVYVEQNYKGIKIYGSVSPFVIQNNQVISANLSFANDLAAKTNSTSPSISALAAISKATNHLGINTPSGLSLLETKDNYSYIFSNGGISLENIPVRLVYQKMDEENGNLKLAWDLSIYLLDGSHYYSVRIDAVTGDLLDKDDWVISCAFGDSEHSHSTGESVLFPSTKDDRMAQLAMATPSYRVFPIPMIGPNEGSSQLVSDPSDPFASPYGWHDTDGMPGADYTTSRGNNVVAWEDLTGNNGSGQLADGGAAMQFDFPFNLPTNPHNFTNGAITNLFYMNNIMHDVFYQYGFDEASGNFQVNNYGKGGTANDMVIADAQDGDGLNNANFATGTDGIPGRMQMYLWTPPVNLIGSFLTVNNGPLSGSYYTNIAQFGTPVPTTPITADLALVTDDNSGAFNDPHDGCDVILNPTDLQGKIAVIRRGNCDFVAKVQAAEIAGAIAVVIVNNVIDDPIPMGGTDPGINIPSVLIYQADGEAIITALLNNETINATLVDDGSADDSNQRDGDLDNVIVAHEYGHGISVRLTGGRLATSCLRNDEQMGEGWSDYFGLMLTMKPTDTRDMARGIGTYALGQLKGGTGLRSMPYSTDFSKNNFTYNRIKFLPVPHGVGSVWTAMLWDMTWDFIDEYGFDPDIYEGTGGNNMALQLVVDALKIQPCSPGFVDGRDAIIQADLIANGGANKCLIWNAFAKRGLGLSAVQGSSNNKMDGSEAYDVPAECKIGVGDHGSIDNGFIIYPNPSNGDLNVRSKFDVAEAQISIFDMNGRKVFDKQIDLQQARNIDVSILNSGIYLVQIEGGGYSQTSKLIIN